MFFKKILHFFSKGVASLANITSDPNSGKNPSFLSFPEQYQLNNSAYGLAGPGLPHPQSNHSTLGLNKYASLKAVGESHITGPLNPTDTVTFGGPGGGGPSGHEEVLKESVGLRTPDCVLLVHLSPILDYILYR